MSYSGSYDEEAFLRGILDHLFAFKPEFNYDLEKIEDNCTYNLIVKSGESVINSFPIDPRFKYGLGIPVISLPCTSGMGWTDRMWVPLGDESLVANAVFAKGSLDVINQVSVADLVPLGGLIRAKRLLWPVETLYQEIDMSNLVIENGRDYQDFGCWAFRVLRSVEAATKIKGRWRPKYFGPYAFELYSDEFVQYPFDMDQKTPLQVSVKFNGGLILIESLLDNSMTQSIQLQNIMYPPVEWMIPLTKGEDEMVGIKDTVPAPSQKSEFEKEQARTDTKNPQKPMPINPNEEVDVGKIMDSFVTVVNNEAAKMAAMLAAKEGDK